MTTLRAYGIVADLPPGIEGRIYRRPDTGPGRTRAVGHFGSIALAPQAADFGGGDVERLGHDDVLVILFEYGPESLGTALFARHGLPRRLGPADFRRNVLRRGLPYQSGTQWFFTEAARPFTLYAVLGDHRSRGTLVPRVNAVLAGISFDTVAR